MPSIEMGLADTILLQRNDVPSLLDIEECMNAVEHAFCLYANGKALPLQKSWACLPVKAASILRQEYWNGKSQSIGFFRDTYCYQCREMRKGKGRAKIMVPFSIKQTK